MAIQENMYGPTSQELAYKDSVCTQQSHTAIRQDHPTLLFMAMQSNTTMPHDKEL
jgi:hypothetical protein